MNAFSSLQQPTDSGAWSEIEQLVEDVSRLAKSELSARGFHAALLDKLVRALAADGGAVWVRETAGRFVLSQQVNAPAVLLSDDPGQAVPHQRLLARIADAGVA